MKIWALASLVLMVIGWLAGQLFGPFQPWTLKRKLGLAALGCVALVAGFLAVYFLSPGLFADSWVKSILSFSGIALLVFLVSTWCLSVAHALGLLNRALAVSQNGNVSADDERTINNN